MLRKICRILLFASILLLTSFPVAAWDEVGHKITAYIAWQRMTPATRERVIKILREAPEDSQLATFYASNGYVGAGVRGEESRHRAFFMMSAYWADIVRDREFPVRQRKYHHSNWHYSDRFWTLRDGKIEYLPAPDDGGLGLAKVIEFDKVISSSAPDAEKAIAIAWLEHLIGDLHQPLHTSARVTGTEPKGDQGGNLFSLTPKGTPRDKQENLHWFWDSIVMRNIPNSENGCEAEYIDPLAEKFMKKHPYEKMRARLLPGRYEEWVTESLKLAQEDVFSPDLKRWEMPSTDYKKKALKIAEEQLALAGYRMGDLFNQAFTATAAQAPAPAAF